MIREGSIRRNAVAEIISTDRPRRKRDERERRDDACTHDRERGATRQREKKNSLAEEKKGAREREKERNERRRSRRVIGQTSRYFRTSLDRTDARVRRGRRTTGEGEAAMNFALPEDEVTEERGGARERSAMHSGKK